MRRLKSYAALCSGALLLVSAPTSAQTQKGSQSARTQPPLRTPTQSVWVPSTTAFGVPTLPTTDLSTLTPNDLATNLLGGGVTISNVTFTGDSAQGGTFTGGTGIIGFESGVVLSSGNVAAVAGPDNTVGDTTTDFSNPGDADLEAINGGIATFDAAVLEFDFECSASTTVSFQFVFASEEYNEWVFQFNDTFGLFLNGTNIAIVPGTTDAVTIDTVNCGDGTLPGVNCGQYVDNECTTFPCQMVPTEMDGLTMLFSAVGTLQPGTNHLKIAVADALDGSWDSVVFLRASSLVCATPAPSFDPPTPCGETLTVSVGSPLTFDAVGLATNGLAGQGVSIDASGDPAPLNGGTFTPALPTALGQPAQTQFSWTPTAADVGMHTITLTATDQLGQASSCDVDVLVTFGTPYCDPTNNSTGVPGTLYASGSLSVANNNLTAHAINVPDGQLMYFLASRGQDFVMNPGGSDGHLCLGGGQGIARYHNTTGMISGGMHSGLIDWTNVPEPPLFGVMALAGETWNLQGWHREAGGGSNFTNGLSLTLQ